MTNKNRSWSVTTFVPLIVVFLELFILPVPALQTKCPEGDNTKLHRLGKTRFYAIHNIDRSQQDFYSFSQANDACDQYGLRLAKVDKITTESVLRRYLEPLSTVTFRLKDTWYWINAKFNVLNQRYEWEDTHTPVAHTNFFYRQPKPVGLGIHTALAPHNTGIYQQCLTLALPWPVRSENGHQTTLDERACESKKARNVLCEAPMYCEKEIIGPDDYGEGKEMYLDEGHWIFGERRYIINWKSRDYQQASQYCKSLSLQLYIPREGDNCLVPFLKLWTRRISGMHFWTNLKYIPNGGDQGNFEYQNGTNVDPSLSSKFPEEEKRSGIDDDEYCVSLAYSYEFKNETNCPTCNWAFLNVVPANCFNPIGTICQHEDAGARQCKWEGKKWFKDPSVVIARTATLPYGFKGSNFYRSTYKQKFGSRLCPAGSRMVRGNNTAWHSLKTMKNYATGQLVYQYDFKDPYWVVDAEGFDKAPGSLCSVSKLVFNVRSIIKVDCNEWHFYLCAKDLL